MAAQGYRVRVMTADLVYVVAGGALFLAIVLPELLDRWAVSAPMVLLGVGLLIGLTPLPDEHAAGPAGQPSSHRARHRARRAGGPHGRRARPRPAARACGPLAILGGGGPPGGSCASRMPLTVAGVALLGWAAGLAPAAALLLGAALAPTDPVLASDVQVAGPQTGDHEVDETDEVRFTLTSEAGLNDGLAFPFVYAAILLATEGAVAGGPWSGSAFYLIGKVVIGVVGRHRGRPRARLRGVPVEQQVAAGRRARRVAAGAGGPGDVVRRRRGLGGYGFLSVFVCAMTFRSAERSHDYHAAMHEVAERLERLLTLFVLLVLGIALGRGSWTPRLAGGRGRASAWCCRGPAARRASSRWPSARGGPPPRRAGAGRALGRRVLRRPRRRIPLLPGVRGRGGPGARARTGCGRPSPSRS